MSWRARIGIVLPADGIIDDEYWQLIPSGVGIQITRTPVPPEDITVDLVTRLAKEPDIEEAAKVLIAGKPDCIAYACTSISFIRGAGYDEEIIKRIENATGISATTTSTAAVKALKYLGVKKVAVGTPYLDEINARLEQFFEANGLDVISMEGFKLTSGIGKVPPGEVYNLAKKADQSNADGIFISCTNLRTVDIIEHLEQDLGKPVVTANQATMWEALRLTGVNTQMSGLGQLYAQKR